MQNLYCAKGRLNDMENDIKEIKQMLKEFRLLFDFGLVMYLATMIVDLIFCIIE